MALNLTDATAYAMRGLSWPGAPHLSGNSRKYSLSTAVAKVALPKDAGGKLPALMRFTLPAGAKVYAAFGKDAAAIPSTSADGDVEIRDGDVAAVSGVDHLALVAEANATVTISYLWT